MYPYVSLYTSLTLYIQTLNLPYEMWLAVPASNAKRKMIQSHKRRDLRDVARRACIFQQLEQGWTLPTELRHLLPDRHRLYLSQEGKDTEDPQPPAVPVTEDTEEDPQPPPIPVPVRGQEWGGDMTIYEYEYEYEYDYEPQPQSIEGIDIYDSKKE